MSIRQGQPAPGPAAANTAVEVTPRVLLLQEDQATGGVTTIANTLCQGLRQRGWHVTVLALNHGDLREQLGAARHCDVILASHNFRPAYVGWALGRIWRKPLVVWVHGPLQEVLAQADASPVKRAWLRWLYRRVRHLAFVSQASRDSFERFMNSSAAPRQRRTVIPNAIAQLEPTGTPPGPDSVAEPQLAYIGRLSAEKRPALLLDALRRLPDRFRLTLVGEGPLRDALEQEGADLLASGRLKLAGPQPHGPALYTPWHMTLLASRYEGCPMTVLESFALGVPCVALPIPALREVLGDDAPYLLADDESAQALAESILAVWARPRREVQADMARVLSRHRLHDFVTRWQSLLQEAARPC